MHFRRALSQEGTFFAGTYVTAAKVSSRWPPARDLIGGRLGIWHAEITCESRPLCILIGYDNDHTKIYLFAGIFLFLLHRVYYGKRYVPWAGHTAKFEVVVTGAPSYKMSVVVPRFQQAPANSWSSYAGSHLMELPSQASTSLL